MPSVKLPGEANLPKFSQVVTPQFLQALAKVESGHDPLAVGLNDVEPPDQGLFQFQPTTFRTMFKREFGFDLPQKQRGLADNELGPSVESAQERATFDPYVSTRLAHAQVNELYTNLSVHLPGFKNRPIDEQREAITAAYNMGQGAFVKAYKQDKDFFRKRTDQASRGIKLNKFIKEPLTQQFFDYLNNDHETRKRAIIKGKSTMAEITASLDQAGFREIVSPQQPQAKGVLFPISTKPIEDANKALYGNQPIQPVSSENSLVGSLLAGIQQKAGEFEDWAQTVPDQAVNVLGNVGKALQLPGQVGMGLGINGMPSGVDELLQNAVDASGVKYNKAVLGVTTPDELKDAKDQYIEKTLSAGYDPDPSALADFDKAIARSDAYGNMTELALSIPPFLPILRPFVSAAKEGPQVLKTIGKGAARKEEETALSIYGQARSQVEKPTDLVWETVGDTKFDPDAFDKAMAQDVIHGDIGKSLPKQAPMQDISTTRRASQFTIRERIQDAGLDALAKVSPTGEAVSLTIQNALNRSEQSTGLLFSRVKKAFQDVFGRRIVGALSPIKGASASKYFNLSPKESDALVEMLYRGDVNPNKTITQPGKAVAIPGKPGKPVETHIEQKIDFTKAPWNLPPDRVKKIQEMAERYYREGTYPVSEHAGVRQLEIMTPDGKTIPVGNPSMFFPHVPVKVELQNMLHGRRFEILYKLAKRNDPDLTRLEYRDKLQSTFGMAGRVKGRGPEAHFAGLENARIFDAAKVADESGKTVAQVLRDFGYESEPIKALVHFAAGGLRRGEIELIHDPLVKMAGKLEEELLAHNPKHAQFGNKVVSHFLNIDQKEMLDQSAKGLVSVMLNTSNISLLQMAAPANLAQLAFVFSRGSIGSFLKGSMRSVANTFKAGDPLGERSGALFIEMMQEWSTPATMLGKLSQDSFRMTGFTGVNRAIRSFAANVGMYDTLRITGKLAKDPTNPKWIRAVEELGLNHKSVLEDYRNLGGISERNLARAIQVFANRVANREGLTGVPNWAASNKGFSRILLQYKKFALANHAEARRQFLNAPSTAEAYKRVAKLFFGATVAGELVKDFRTLVARFSNPFDPNDVDRNGKPRKLNETLDQEIAKRLFDDLFNGYGTILAMLVSSAYSGKEGVYRFFAPPGVAAVAEFSENPGATVGRRIPLVGPQAETVIRNQQKKRSSGSLGNIGSLGKLGNLKK